MHTSRQTGPKVVLLQHCTVHMHTNSRSEFRSGVGQSQSPHIHLTLKLSYHNAHILLQLAVTGSPATLCGSLS